MKTIALQWMRRFGVFSATRLMSSHLARVLMYHDFCADDDRNPEAVGLNAARKHLEHLKKNYRIVPLSILAERLANGRGLESRTVSITIDDGRRNVYEHFFPLLREFQVPATLFVVTSFIDGTDWIWTDKVLWLSKQATDLPELAHSNLPKLFSGLNRQCTTERDAHINQLASIVGVKIPAGPPASYQPCSWQELREMADSGVVQIGSHTITHPILSSISDEQSWTEIAESRRCIEKTLGREVKCFCPPNGAIGDYRPSQVEQVKKAGYSCLVTTEFGFVNGNTDRFRIPRIGAGRSDLMSFYKRIDGVMYYRDAWGRLAR